MTRFPTNNELMTAVLNALKALGGESTSKEIEAMVIVQLQLPDELTKVITPVIANRTELSSRLALARNSLKRLGTIENPKNGIWALKADTKVQDDIIPPNSDAPVFFDLPDCSPFDPSNDFAQVFAILYAYRDTGITKPALLNFYRSVSGKDKKRATKDVNIVISSKRDGKCHDSIANEAQYYFVIDHNGLLTMCVVNSLEATMPKFTSHFTGKSVVTEPVANAEDDYNPPVVTA